MHNQPRILKQRKHSINKYPLQQSNTIVLSSNINAINTIIKDKQKQRQLSMGPKIRSTSVLPKHTNYNAAGFLGTQNQINRNSMMLSSNVYNKTVANNLNKTQILKGENLVIWGQANFINSNNKNNQNIPILLSQNIIKYSLGQSHIIYINNKYQAYGVGSSIFGQLGYFQPLQMVNNVGDNEQSQFLNITGIPLLQELLVQDVYCTPFCTFLITNRDEIYGCGLNNRGQLGLGSSNISQNCQSSPAKISSLSKRSLITKQISSALKSSKKLKQPTKIQSYALAQKNQREMISQESKLFTQKSQGANSDIYLNTNNLNTQNSNQLQLKQQKNDFQDTECILEDGEVITSITGGPYHTIALSNRGRVFYTGNIYKKSAILNNQYTTKFTQLNLKKIGKVQKIKSGLNCIGLLNIQGNLFILGAINDNIICDQPYNVGISCIVDFAIAKDKIYSVTSIGDVWVLVSNKKSLKTYKINFDDNKQNKVIPKIISVQCGIDYCFFTNQNGQLFGEGHNYANIFGKNPDSIKKKPQPNTKSIQNYEYTIFKLNYKMNIKGIKSGLSFAVGLNDKYPEKGTSRSYQQNKENSLQESNQNLNKKIQQLEKQNKMLKQLVKNQNSESTIQKAINNSSKKKQQTNSNNAGAVSGHLSKKISNHQNLSACKFDMNLNMSQKVMSKARKFDHSMEIPFEQIELGKQISEGGYGIIYKATWRKTTVAVKIFKIDTNSQNSIKDFVSECHAMQALRHPNIVMFLGACTKPPNFAIVLEYCEGGTLWSILQKNGELSWQQRRRLSLDTAKGMNYLHERPTPILHRDLKSLNLLLDENKRIKLADFGWTKGLQNYMTGKIGTYQWMAPQVVSSHQYTEKADVFSFAIILWQIASRQAPYRNIPGVQVAQDVLHKDLRPTIPKKTPQPFAALMKKCWDKTAQNRPSFTQIIDQLETMQLPS